MSKQSQQLISCKACGATFFKRGFTNHEKVCMITSYTVTPTTKPRNVCACGYMSNKLYNLSRHQKKCAEFKRKQSRNDEKNVEQTQKMKMVEILVKEKLRHLQEEPIIVDEVPISQWEGA